MDDILAVKDKFYILAGSPLADARRLVLKQGDTFAVFGPAGDIEEFAGREQGLYTSGMRFLSRLQVRLLGQRPLLLSASISRGNTRLHVDLTNPDIGDEGRVTIPRGTIHLSRHTHLRGGACFERLAVTNFGEAPLEADLDIAFEADFADIFEVRGTARERRGLRHEPDIVGAASVVLAYEGLDGVSRRTRLEFDPAPSVLEGGRATYRLALAPGRRTDLFLTTRTSPAGAEAPSSYRASIRHRPRENAAPGDGFCRVVSSSALMDSWVRRSLADIRMLLTELPTGVYPFAGIPWYSCPFGRDGIVTAQQLLWVNPAIARGVLSFLAANQASAHDPERDAEPGKILHEWRDDEMANTGEVPFGRYYGSVDATPLFAVLAGAYYTATADLAFCETLWPHVERALAWMDTHGDCDGDGFVEYQTKTAEGLTNHGWKDSGDSIFHADGSLASSPIALCEVQGYVYDAKVRAANLARALGHMKRAEQLEHQATILKSRFHEFFWCEAIGTYALALDGRKRQCAVRTSNPGHCLASGIVDGAAAARVADALLDRSMHSGWGIRTVARSERRYNPMSYHNGSIWPHDNAVIAQGLARYGFDRHALTVFTGMLEASGYLDLHRLPELFCGFRRRPGNGPTLYPVACSPQAWASGAVYMLLAATLGMTVDASKRLVRIVRPMLPAEVERLHLKGVRVGDAVLDLEFGHEVEDVSVVVRRVKGAVRVQVEK